MKPQLSLSCLLLFALIASSAEPDPTRVFPDDHKSKDARVGKVKTLNDYFPMTVPQTLPEWEARKKSLREQVHVATGLWPMPEKTPLNPVIHGKIERDGYTVEKVFFASMPGHYVSGNLYRPKLRDGEKLKDKAHAGVLCPHGHWANGRFFDAGEKTAENDVKNKAEKTIAGGRHPLQARCAQLARMGCVVFHYDMVGNADSQSIAHRAGFTDVDAELRLQSFMGLQTWNSIRALDFLLALPDVDPARIGVTGASGGGTQTFMLCAIDDRPTVAFPAVMVSTAMQGGCICENCSYLRIDAGNIDLAALCAPRPLAMSGAKDWTIDIETKGLPELKAVYRLYGAEDRVLAKCFPQFGHNYNQVSRELMYNWFNVHLKLGQKEPVEEKPFEPVPPKELSVYDAQHPRPQDALNAEQLRKVMTEAASKQTLTFDTLRTALRVMIGDTLPVAEDVEANRTGQLVKHDGVSVQKLILGRKGRNEEVPALLVRGDNADGTVVVWIDPRGKASLWDNGKLAPAARKLIEGKATILAVDVFGTGEMGPAPLPVNKQFAGYTYGYNRPVVANRVHDILTAIAFAHKPKTTKTVHLVGFDAAGPWVLLARGLSGNSVARTAADVNGFRFDTIKATDDPMMLPGALKYGGLASLAGLAAPGELFVHNTRGSGTGKGLKDAYKAVADKLEQEGEKATSEKVVGWLLR